MISQEELLRSRFIADWVDDNVIYFKLQYPNADEKVLRKILLDIALEHTKNHKAYLHNDYQDDMRVNTDLLKLYDWYYKNRPIAAGHGTFFYNQDIRKSPIQNVIDGRIAARKEYQKIRDTYIGPGGDTSNYEYQYYEMMQMEAKVKINAIYGAFGAKTFQLYNIYTASSTTGTAQSLISTTAMAFEAFLNNAVKFKSLGELMTLIGNVLVKDKWTISIDGLRPMKDPEVVFKLWKSQFWEWKDEYEPILRNVLRNRSVEELTRLYYINNLFAFVENEMISMRLIRIFNVTKEFRNPNKLPDNIVEDSEFLWDYCREFVFYNHAYTEQIDRLKHDPRTRVILIDTDSNVINIKPWVDWTREHIWDASSTEMGDEDKQFCSVNILAYLVTRMARELLDRYADDCNVLPRFHKRLNTKNEFYFPKVLLANAKKRYIAHIKLREGKQISKIELKGHDFKKAGVNANIEHELMKIIREDIIDDPLVNVTKLMSDTAKLEQKIRKSIHDRERTYLVRMNCKVERSYKDPYSQGAFTGPLLWNLINPDNVIMIPDKCDVVFINIPDLKTVEEKLMPNFPREANIIKKFFFSDTTIPQLKGKGVKYLALPNDDSKIPEWVYPVLDEERIITRNTGTFYPVLRGLMFITIKAGDNEYASNILNV